MNHEMQKTRIKHKSKPLSWTISECQNCGRLVLYCDDEERNIGKAITVVAGDQEAHKGAYMLFVVDPRSN